MTKALTIGLALAAILLAGEAQSTAAVGLSTRVSSLIARMDARQVVTVSNKPWQVPAAVAKARGTFTGRLDDRARKLTWHLTYSGVGASALQIADIHLGKPGHFGQILVRLCASCRTDQSGVKKISLSAERAIKSGAAWITLITDRYPNGVIRGQIKATPR